MSAALGPSSPPAPTPPTAAARQLRVRCRDVALGVVRSPFSVLSAIPRSGPRPPRPSPSPPFGPSAHSAVSRFPPRSLGSVETAPDAMMSAMRHLSRVLFLGALVVNLGGCAAPATLDPLTGDTGGPLSDNERATDVLRYELTLEVFPDKKMIRGEGVTVLRALEPLETVELQLDGRFDVPEVRVGGEAAALRPPGRDPGGVASPAGRPRRRGAGRDPLQRPAPRRGPRPVGRRVRLGTNRRRPAVDRHRGPG